MDMLKNKRKKDSEERIEKVFLNLVQTKDIKDISVSKICELANVNRTTFYANYLDIYDLVDKVRDRMVNEFVDIFDNPEGHRGHTRENYLKMFQHIKDNQIFYKTYFKLNFDTNYKIDYYDKELAKERYQNKFIDYHCEFFKAGITAIIKMWLDRDCKENPEDIAEIIESEYKKSWFIVK